MAKKKPRSRTRNAAKPARRRRAASKQAKRAASPRHPPRPSAGVRQGLRAARPRKARPRRLKAAARRGASRSARPRPAALERQRRRLAEADIVQGPPSTLNYERRGSAARSGQAGLAQHRRAHPESGPGLTGGDIDADWVDAYGSGDEAPGGDNPTPDQDVVEEIGRALGVEYEDAEELKGADKIGQRDRHRWEYDPASSEDYKDRSKK